MAEHQYQHKLEFHASGAGLPIPSLPPSKCEKVQHHRSTSKDVPLIQVSSATISSVGSPTTLVCRIHGRGSLRSVEWFYNEEQCIRKEKYCVMSDSEHQCYLYIHNITTGDAGEYKVVARNDHGKSEEVITLSLSEPEPPKNDHTRVILSLLEGIPGSDYVNASHIDDIYTPKGYIASQGPIPNTFEDHWRMILECNVNVIAMVTRTTEKQSIKCHQYWPSNGSASYGRYSVSLKQEESLPYCAIRTFSLSEKCASGDSSHVVKQFQFLSWPEYGVPSRAKELLDFRKSVIEYHSSVQGPLLVHCSAGVGRTGTFLCVDSILKRIESDETVNVFNFVRQLRFKRERTVETEEQYRFIHSVLAEYLEGK